MRPSFETRGTLAIASVFNPGAVQSLDRQAPVSEVIEAFLGNQIPNRATARGYRRHLTTINTTQRYVSHLDQLDLRKAIPAFLSGGKGPRVLPSVK